MGRVGLPAEVPRQLPDRATTRTRRPASGTLLLRAGSVEPVKVIEDIDRALESLVRREALNGAKVEVLFDAPTRDWVARRNAPTVDLYLYDIREDLLRREANWSDVRNGSGVVVGRHSPPRRFKLSYLVTAWTQRPEDEHRLLSGLLGCFLAHDTVPDNVLEGPLADQPLPIYLTVALPPTADRSLADIWSALGGELKPSLDVAVTAPFVVRQETPAGPPVREAPRIIVGPSAGAAAAGRPGRSGKVGPSAEGAGDAPVASTDLETEFEELALRAGQRVRRVRHASALEAAMQDETVSPGGGGEPGRQIRVRGLDRP